MSIYIGPGPARDPADDYPVEVDFTNIDVFVASPVTTATVTVAPSGLTLGAVTVASNIAYFEVSGGTAGVTCTVTITATNAASPPNVIRRTFAVPTA